MRLTDAAIADLDLLARSGNPQVVRWALKKCLMLERDPEAGDVLRGALIGFRKLVVGDRDWRVVWRVTHDASGATIVDVAQVWAVGARSDSEVYVEMRQRVAMLGRDPRTVPLSEAIESLSRLALGLDAAIEPVNDAAPEWLVSVLTKVVGMPYTEIAKLSADQAHQVWDAYTSRSR